MTTIDADLLSKARAIGPLLKDEGETAEGERRITKPALDALAEAGFLRLVTPRALGGLEADPLTVATIIEEVASHDSTAGWTLMTGNAVDWFCARLPDGGPEEIYAQPDPVIAAAFHPPMQAVETAGGYRISGRAPLASTVHDATWFHGTAVIMDGSEPRMVEGAPVAIGVIVRAAEVEVLDTWHSLGMRGTDSNDVALTKVYVPTSRTFPLVPNVKPGLHYQGPLYRLPAMAFVAFVGPPVFLGMARAALGEFHQLTQQKTPFGALTTLRDRAAVQAGVARAEGLVRSGRAYLHSALAEAWNRACAGETPTLQQRADSLLAATQAVSSAVQAVEQVHRLAGTTGIYTRSRLERHFRDIETLRHHGFMSESRYETFGQVYLGVEPEFALVAL